MGAQADMVPPVLQLRVALTAADYDRLAEFYCVGLGIEPSATWQAAGGNGILLDLGSGTLEVFDREYARLVDEAEVGEPVSGPVRLALQVPDVHAAVKRVLAHGATLVHETVLTPWGDLNARVESPDGLQITLFQTAENPSEPDAPIRTLGLDAADGDHRE